MILLSVAHAEGRGAFNKEYNLDEYSLSKRMTKAASWTLTSNNIENVVLDVGNKYPYRSNKINFVNHHVPEPRLAIEIHLNSSINKKAKYISSFYWHYSKESQLASQYVCDSLKEGYINYGWKDVRNIPLPCEGYDLDRFWFITNVVYPSILVEPMFLSNAEQAEFLKSEGGPELIGTLIGNGIVKLEKEKK